MAKLGFTASEIASKKYVDDAIANAGGGVTVDQTYNAESENPQSGKAVAEAVSSRVPKKSANPGAPFPSVIATSNSSYDEYGIPTDDSYMCINTVGAELGKDVNNSGAFINSIPRRDNKGNLFTGTPVDDEDCVNKKYITDNYIPIKTSELQEYQVYAVPDALGAKTVEYLTVENPMYFETGQSLGTIPSRQTNGNIMTNAPAKDLDCANKKYVDDRISEIPSGGGGETWEVISDTTTEFDTPVSQIVINQDTNGNSFSLKKMRVFIDFTVSETYTGGFARALTASSGLMYIVSQSFSAGTVYGYFIDSEVLPMVNNRCQIISHFNENRMSENGNNFNFEYNSGAVDYAIRTEKTTATLLGYNVSSISNFDFRLGSAGKINKARILIFGVRA